MSAAAQSPGAPPAEVRQAEQAARAAERAAEQAARAAEQASERAIEQAVRAAERAAERSAAAQGFPPMPPEPPPAFAAASGQPTFPFHPDRPSDHTIGLIAVAFFFTIIMIAVGVPFVRALARKWERQAAGGGTSPEVEARLERIERAVETIAVEVERIGEGQRYTNQVMSELRALPSAGAANAERALLDRAAQAGQGARDRAR